MRLLEIRRLGVVPYLDALAMQRALVEDRRSGHVDDLLLLVEHPHVLTLGVRGDGGRSHIVASAETLAARGVDVHETDRGGDITYHGPGQAVGYPIVHHKPYRSEVNQQGLRPRTDETDRGRPHSALVGYATVSHLISVTYVR